MPCRKSVRSIEAEISAIKEKIAATQLRYKKPCQKIEIWQDYRKRLTRSKAAAPVGPCAVGFVRHDREGGRILHILQSRLPFRPRLAYITYIQCLGEAGARQASRHSKNPKFARCPQPSDITRRKASAAGRCNPNGHSGSALRGAVRPSHCSQSGESYEHTF